MQSSIDRGQQESRDTTSEDQRRIPHNSSDREANHHDEDEDRVDLSINFEGIAQLQTFGDRKLARIKARFGEQHPTTAAFHSSLATEYSTLEDHKSATHHYSKCLEIRTSVLGDQHYETLIAYNRFAGAYQSLKDYEEAESMYLWAVEVTKTLFGDNHINTAASYINLANTYRGLKNFDQAKEYVAMFSDTMKNLLKEGGTSGKVYLEQEKKLEEAIQRLNNECTDNIPAKVVTESSKIVSNRELSQYNPLSVQQAISENPPKRLPPKNWGLSPEEIEYQRRVYKAEGRDDIIIACDVDELAKMFFKECIIIWYDPKSGSESSLERLKKLNANIEVKVFNDIEEAYQCVKTSSTMCQIITPNIDGEAFVKMISGASSILSIYVLCDKKNLETEWVKKYPKILMTGSNFTKLTTKMHNDSLKMDFPAFAPVFDDMDKTKTNKLHFYLTGFVHFYNDKQAKDDLLALAHKVYKDKQNMKEFTDTYTKYDMALILTWYTKQSFLYKMVNNCLRIASSDSILYTRLAIRDLEDCNQRALSDQK